MSFSPHEVYAKCLLGARGYPLWTPQLNIELRETYQLNGLKIGDVGVISPIDGSFDVLFNITLPRNEQPYPRLVRENFAPIVLDQELDLATRPDAVAAHGVIPSASVRLISKEVESHDQTPPRADYEFSMSKGHGAVLVLPEGAQSCDLRNESKFLDEAIRHGVDWYECITKDAGRLIDDDSLYLITGFHKTRSWSLGAAERSDSSFQDQRSVKFKVGQIHQGSATARAYLWLATHGFEGRVGPMYPYEISNHIPSVRLGANQTVFIRGFRITVNKLLFLKAVSVKTRQGTFYRLTTHLTELLSRGKSEPTSSEGPTDNAVDQDSAYHGRLHSDTRMTIDRVPDIPQAFHPGDSINQYMLKKEPDAMVAITHDSLWIEMVEGGLLEVADFSRENSLEEVLSKNFQVILRDGAVYLQRGYSTTEEPHDSDIAMAAGVTYSYRGRMAPSNRNTHIWVVRFLRKLFPRRSQQISGYRHFISTAEVDLRRLTWLPLAVLIQTLTISESRSVILALLLYTISLRLAIDIHFLKNYRTAWKFLYVVSLLGTFCITAVALISGAPSSAFATIYILLAILPLIAIAMNHRRQHAEASRVGSSVGMQRMRGPAASGSADPTLVSNPKADPEGLREFSLSLLTIVVVIIIFEYEAPSLFMMVLLFFTIAIHLENDIPFFEGHSTLLRFLHVAPLFGIACMAGIDSISNAGMFVFATIFILSDVLLGPLAIHYWRYYTVIPQQLRHS